MVNSEKPGCPYCGTVLNQWTETTKGVPIYECGNCLSPSGTLPQLAINAEARNRHMEDQSPRFECTECHGSFPIFRHYKYCFENIKGMIHIRHVCPECEIALKEKKK
jgi:hypothetical protein